MNFLKIFLIVVLIPVFYRSCSGQQKDDINTKENLVLQMDVRHLIFLLSGNNKDVILSFALNITSDSIGASSQNFVDLFYAIFQKVKPGVKLAPLFATLYNSSLIKYDTPDSEVVVWLKNESRTCLDRDYMVIYTRLHKSSFADCNLTRDENKYRIKVGAASNAEPDRLRRLLTDIGDMEFYEIYDFEEINLMFMEASQEYNKAAGHYKYKGADTVESKSLLLMLTNNDTYKPPVPDLAKLALVASIDTAEVGRILKMPNIKAIFPGDILFQWSAKPEENNDHLYALYGLRGDSIVLAGDKVINAKLESEDYGGYPVDIEFSTEGRVMFRDFTRRNIGKSLAISSGNKVLACPRIMDEIKGGKVQITGDFSEWEAIDFANISNSGSMPVQLKIISEEVKKLK